MEDQGRQMNRRQNMADIDLVIRAHQGEDRTRTRRGALERAEPPQECFILAPARSVERNQNALAPVLLQRGEESPEVLTRYGPRARSHRGISAVQHKA